MSYPPRPPMMPMGGMPPMIPPYGYRPMMPPMPPMMAPLMSRPVVPPPNFSMMNKPPGEKAPVTKVFVGNISERAPDPMMRQMLQRCGSIISWKRVEGANGKLQAFGFCEYDNPEATLRCIRLLNGYEIAEKKLLVKVDQKTRELLGEYIKKKRTEDKAPLTKNAKKAAMLRNIPNKKYGHSEDGEIEDEESPGNINLELVDEDTLKEDRAIIGAFELILKQYANSLAAVPVEPEPAADAVPKPVETENPAPVKPPTEEEAKPKLEEKETAIKLSGEKVTEKVKEKERERDRDRDRDRERERDREKREKDGKTREKTPDRSRRTSRHRSRSADKIQGRNSSRSRRGRSKSRTRSRSPSFRSTRRRTSTDRVRDAELSTRNVSPVRQSKSEKENKPAEDPEEERERKRLERKLREKELAYRNRLKQWEEREDKRRKQYATEKKSEMQRRKLVLKDAKKLRQFMEDYEDEKDDSSHYKGGNLEKKLKFREKEIETDNRDRIREKEELEELKKKLLEKGLSDAENEAKRIHEEENQRMKIKFEKLEQPSSSSEDESDAPSDSEHQPNTHQPNEEPNQNGNGNLDRYEAQEETKNQSEDEERVKQALSEDSNQSMRDEKDEEVLKNQQAPPNYSEESNSPYNQNYTYNESPPISNESATKQVRNEPNENYGLSSPSSNSPFYSGNANTESLTAASHSTHSVTIKTFTKKSIQPINQAFADEDEDSSNGPQLKRARLTSLQNELEGKKTNDQLGLVMSSEERRKAVKKLVESIPTDRDELFAYNIDWDQLDESLMEKRIKPWINKKIIEYIGEEEQTLNDFICSKIRQRTKAEKLLEEVKVILEDDAELFIKKMWRLIVYETESKRCGLSK